jgi:endo-1,4-beta-xylanase
MICTSRRNVLAASAALAATGRAVFAAENRGASAPVGAGLKTLSPFPVGTAFSSAQFDEPDLLRLVTKNFAQVTPEWQMKMDAIQKADGALNLKDSDIFVQRAQASGLQVHGHALIWYLQRAPYFNTLDGSRVRFEAAYAQYIAGVAGHFSGKLRGWDVVNECIAEDGVGYRECLWTENLTISYVGLAFQHARAADRKAVLFLNDYNLESNPRKRRQFLTLAESLLKQGVPLGGLGSQTHVQTSLPKGAIRACIKELSGLGLPIHISEFDVSTPKSISVMTPDLAAKKASLVEEAAEAFLALPASQRYGFTTWGLRDGDSFINRSRSEGALEQSPVFLDTAGIPNANMQAFLAAILR